MAVAQDQTSARAKTRQRAGAQQKNGSKRNGSPSAQELQGLLKALKAARNGDFSVRLTAGKDGVPAEVAATFNELVETNDRMAKELVRVSRIIGREGRMTQRASLKTAGGAWATSIDSVNALIDDLVRPTTEV